MNLYDFIISIGLITFGYFLSLVTQLYIEKKRAKEESLRKALTYYKEKINVLKPYLTMCNNLTYGSLFKLFSGDIDEIKVNV